MQRKDQYRLVLPPSGHHFRGTRVAHVLLNKIIVLCLVHDKKRRFYVFFFKCAILWNLWLYRKMSWSKRVFQIKSRNRTKSAILIQKVDSLPKMKSHRICNFTAKGRNNMKVVIFTTKSCDFVYHFVRVGKLSYFCWNIFIIFLKVSLKLKLPEVMKHHWTCHSNVLFVEFLSKLRAVES